MPGRIITNGHVRELVPYVELPESERVRFDYVAQDAGIDPVTGEAPEGAESNGEEWTARFFRYRGYWYDAHDFVRIESDVNPPGMRAPFAHTVPQGDPLAQWVGIATDSHATAVLIRWGTDWSGMTDFDTVVAGYWIGE